jgi:hypothetical protein
MGCIVSSSETLPLSPLIKRTKSMRLVRIREALVEAGLLSENNLSVVHTTNTKQDGYKEKRQEGKEI